MSAGHFYICYSVQQTLFHIAISIKYCPGGHFNIGHYYVLHNNLIRITLGCNNVCRITWGVIWIFQNDGRKFCMRWSIMSFLENKYFPGFILTGPISFRYQYIFVYFRRLLLSKWIMEKAWKILIMQRMMTLLAS